MHSEMRRYTVHPLSWNPWDKNSMRLALHGARQCCIGGLSIQGRDDRGRDLSYERQKIWDGWCLFFLLPTNCSQVTFCYAALTKLSPLMVK